MSSFKWACVVAVSSFLVACGGGGSSGPFGAIAVSQSRAFAAIVSGLETRDAASSKVLELCGGGDCHIALEISGTGVCAGLAGSGNGTKVFGVAKGATAQEAETEAVVACTRNGGEYCSVPTKLRAMCQ